MDNNDSPDGPECVICYKKIGDFPYAIINKKGENGKYHIECLEQWLRISHNKGVLTQDATESYSLYQNDQLIETININKKLEEIIDIYETETLLNNSIEPNRCYRCYGYYELYDCNETMKASLICGVVVAFIFIIILLFPNIH